MKYAVSCSTRHFDLQKLQKMSDHAPSSSRLNAVHLVFLNGDTVFYYLFYTVIGLSLCRRRSVMELNADDVISADFLQGCVINNLTISLYR